MAAVTGFDTPLDDRGNPYPAVRPAKLWSGALSVGGANTGPFLTTTKVVRVVTGLTDMARVSLNGGAAFIVGRGVYQDFIVEPGDQMFVTLDPAAAAGNYSVLELG
jgi:hypothetical protein